MNYRKLLVMAFVFNSFYVSAYECKNNIESTTPENHFLNNKDGTVTDMRYGLQWQICTFGQVYDTADGSCKGEQKQFPTWSEAILSQDQINGDKAQGYSDWRLPNIKELQSIVERKCRNPAINTKVFIGTNNGVYWSNTPDASVNMELHGRIIDFSDGVEFYRSTAPTKHVRHVRVIKQN